MVGLLCPHLDSTESPERVELPGTDGHAYSPYTSEPDHSVLYHYHTIKTHAILLTPTYCSRVVAFVDGSYTYIPH